MPLGWTLTAIGGHPTLPDNCAVTGGGTSTGVGNVNTQTATIVLRAGDTVTCVFENTGQGVTRTQGFWATHERLARLVWNGGTGYGHNFPGIADKSLCGQVLTVEMVMGGFWSDISKTTTGTKRSALGQARMQLLQQLLAAELNYAAFGTLPAGGIATINNWETAFCTGNLNAVKNAQQAAASFNTAGDSNLFTPGTSANSKEARAIANYVYWDSIN